MVNQYPVSLRREQEVRTSQDGRLAGFERRRDDFLGQYEFSEIEAPSIVNTDEARDLRRWCREGSWSFCGKCGKLSARKLLPSFAKKQASVLDNSCKCGGGTYIVPQVEDVPLILRNLSPQDILVLRPLVVHCGDYKRVVHSYRQWTGPFRLSWSSMPVADKIAAVGDAARRFRLQTVFNFLMAKADSAYAKFVRMQSRGVREPFPHEVFTSPDYQGIECALWPTLYHTTAMCETMLTGQTNRASSKISFMHKALSPVLDYSLDFEMLQFQYDRWLFKTITGAINSSRVSGCSPNTGLQHKSSSATYWRWQHLLLIDTVRQYGYPSFFMTVSPYE